MNIPTASIYDAYESGDQRRDNRSNYLTILPMPRAFSRQVAAFDGKIPFIKKFYHAPYIEDGRSNEKHADLSLRLCVTMLAEARMKADQAILTSTSMLFGNGPVLIRYPGFLKLRFGRPLRMNNA